MSQPWNTRMSDEDFARLTGHGWDPMSPLAVEASRARRHEAELETRAEKQRLALNGAQVAIENLLKYEPTNNSRATRQELAQALEWIVAALGGK